MAASRAPGVQIPGVFIISVFLFFLAAPPPVQAADGHTLVTREPYLPQKYDFGGAVGTAWTTSNYILLEMFGGVRATLCAEHCFQYIDGALRVAAQHGQTNFMFTAGWRFQKYYEESSWGPYLRPFIGTNHYKFSGDNQTTGLGGVALGTYYFLHPRADFRMEIAHAFGPVSFTFLSVGASFKFHNF